MIIQFGPDKRESPDQAPAILAVVSHPTPPPPLLNMYDKEIFPKTLADHNPVFWPLKPKKYSNSWCFNQDLWRDTNFVQFAAADLKNFL